MNIGPPIDNMAHRTTRRTLKLTGQVVGTFCG